MKRLILTIAMVLMLAKVAHAVSVETCVLTFTNITTLSTGATSAVGKCASNTNFAIDTHGARDLQIDWIPNSKSHTATDWDIEVWNSDTVNGQYKYYTDALTNGDAMATFGTHAADTRYDVSLVSGYTYKYTYDGTGTNPSITTTSPARGSTVCFAGFSSVNNGCFIVQSTDTNDIRVYNPVGSAEADIVPGAGNVSNGTNVAGSAAITHGANYREIKVSENGALAIYATITVTVTKD